MRANDVLFKELRLYRCPKSYTAFAMYQAILRTILIANLDKYGSYKFKFFFLRSTSFIQNSLSSNSWRTQRGQCIPNENSCGNGIQSQSAACTKEYAPQANKRDQVLSARECRKAKIGDRPPSEIPCFVKCNSLHWVYSEWSEVRVGCFYFCFSTIYRDWYWSRLKLREL